MLYDTSKKSGESGSLDEMNVAGISSPGRLLSGKEKQKGCDRSELLEGMLMLAILGRRLTKASRKADLAVLDSALEIDIVLIEERNL